MSDAKIYFLPYPKSPNLLEIEVTEKFLKLYHIKFGIVYPEHELYEGNETSLVVVKTENEVIKLSSFKEVAKHFLNLTDVVKYSIE